MTENEHATQSEYFLQKKHLQRHFDNAADSYNKYAVLQKEVAQRLVDRLDYIKLPGPKILDLGAGTGFVSLSIAQRMLDSYIVAADLSTNMLRKLRQSLTNQSKDFQITTVCADAECLPFSSAKFDLVISSLALQWCNYLQDAFAEVKRILKPGGLFMFTIFGPDTLQELRSSWQAVDDDHHVNVFYDMHDIGDALLQQGFADPVMDAEIMKMTYPTLDKLMKDLKMIGATNALKGRSKSLTGKGKIQALKENYETFREKGLLPATYEVVYGHAWVAEPIAVDVVFQGK